MFQARLRLRMARNLNTTDTTRDVQIAGRTVTIRSGVARDAPLAESEWLVFTSHGFATEVEANEFGALLKQTVNAASVCCSLGVDLGDDRTGSWMDTDFARSIGLIEPYERSYKNVHGLQVLEDDPNIRFPKVSAGLSVLIEVDDLLSALEISAITAGRIDRQAMNALVLLNQALINPQPLAKLVLAISAVEALGQDEKWSTGQNALRVRLAESARSDTSLSEEERGVVADMVMRGQTTGLRQGVKRVLTRLDLLHLRKEWNRIYDLRSGIFHGQMSVSEPEKLQLANEATMLCSVIILTLAQQNGFVLPPIAERHFPGSARLT